MTQIATPVTALPLNGVSPTGTLTTSSEYLRLQCVLTSGSADYYLIQMAESGDWFRVPNASISLDYSDPEKRVRQIIVKNGVAGTAYHVLKEKDGPGTVYLAEVVTTTAVATLAATNLTASGTLGVTGASTLTGLLTANGDILLGSTQVLGFGAPQALSGAGACNVTTLATLLTSTGAAQALTLADGTRAGQLKAVCHVVDGGSAVLTPTTKTGFSTVTFTNAFDWVILVWSGSYLSG